MIHGFLLVVLLIVGKGLKSQRALGNGFLGEAARFLLFAQRVTLVNLLVSAIFTAFTVLRLRLFSLDGMTRAEDIAIGMFTTVGDGNISVLDNTYRLTITDHWVHSLVLVISSVAWAINVGVAAAAIQKLVMLERSAR